MAYIPERNRIYLTREQVDKLLDDIKCHGWLNKYAEFRGFKKCLDCPHCKYFYDGTIDQKRNSKLPFYAGDLPHCMLLSPNGTMCRIKGNKSLGKPSRCPIITEDDKVMAKAEKLQTIIANQRAVIAKAKATIAKAEAELDNTGVAVESVAEDKLERIQKIVIEYQNKDEFYLLDSIMILDRIEKILKEDKE